MNDILYQMNILIVEASTHIKLNGELDVEFKKAVASTLESRSSSKKRMMLKDFSEWLLDIDPPTAQKITSFLEVHRR